jgi:hypothetical protein
MKSEQSENEIMRLGERDEQFLLRIANLGYNSSLAIREMPLTVRQRRNERTQEKRISKFFRLQPLGIPQNDQIRIWQNFTNAKFGLAATWRQEFSKHVWLLVLAADRMLGGATRR